MRNIRTNLRSTFFNIFYIKFKTKIFQKQINILFKDLSVKTLKRSEGMIKTEIKILMTSEENMQIVGKQMFILSLLYKLFSYKLYILI